MPKVRTSLILTGIVLAMLAASILTVLGLFMAGVINLNKPELEFSVDIVDAREYDGTPLRAESYTIVAGEDKLKEGHTLKVTILGEQTDCGTSETDLNVKIFDKEDRDVTNAYTIKVHNTDLTVVPRKVTIALEGQQVYYSGAEVVIDKYQVYEGSSGNSLSLDELEEKELAPGEKLAISCPGFMNAGDELSGDGDLTSDNFVIYNAAGKIVTHNYSITATLLAPIVILPRPLGVTALNMEKYYDGKPFDVVFQHVWGTLASNDFIKDVELVDKNNKTVTLDSIITYNDSTKVKISRLIIYRQNGNGMAELSEDEANNYEFVNETKSDDGYVSLNILKRPVEVQARDMVKEYDGTSLWQLVSADKPAYTVIGLPSQYTLDADGVKDTLEKYTEACDESYSISGIEIYENGVKVTEQFEVTSRSGIARITPVTFKLYPTDHNLTYSGEELSIPIDDVVSIADAINTYINKHQSLSNDLAGKLNALITGADTYFRAISSVIIKNAGDYIYTVELNAAGVELLESHNDNMTFEFSSAKLTVERGQIDVSYYWQGATVTTITKPYDGKGANLDHSNLIVDDRVDLTVSNAVFTYANNTGTPGNCALVGSYTATVQNIRISQKTKEGESTVFEDVTENYKITTSTLPIEITKTALYATASQSVVFYEVDDLRNNDYNFRYQVARELRSSITFAGLATGDIVSYDEYDGFALNPYGTNYSDTFTITVTLDEAYCLTNSSNQDVRNCYNFVNDDETVITVHLVVKN